MNALLRHCVKALGLHFRLIVCMSLAKPEVLREIHFLSSWQYFVMNATAALLELIGVSVRVIKCVSSGSVEAWLSHLEKVTFSHTAFVRWR